MLSTSGVLFYFVKNAQNNVSLLCTVGHVVCVRHTSSLRSTIQYNTIHSQQFPSARQTFPRILQNLRFHDRVHNSPTIVPILSQINPVHPLSLRHFNISLTTKSGSSKWFLSLRFPHQTPIHTTPLPHTCHMIRPSHCLTLCIVCCMTCRQ